MDAVITSDPMRPNDTVAFNALVLDSGIVRVTTRSGRTSYGSVQNLFDVLKDFVNNTAHYKPTVIGQPNTTGQGGVLNECLVTQCKAFPAEMREIWARPLRPGERWLERWSGVISEMKLDINGDPLVKLRVEVPKTLWVWTVDTRRTSYPNIPFVNTKVFTYKKLRATGTLKLGWLGMGNVFPSDGHICWPDAFLRLASPTIEDIRNAFLDSTFNSDTNPPRTKWLGRYNPPDTRGYPGERLYISSRAFARSFRHGEPTDIMRRERA